MLISTPSQSNIISLRLFRYQINHSLSTRRKKALKSGRRSEKIQVARLRMEPRASGYARQCSDRLAIPPPAPLPLVIHSSTIDLGSMRSQTIPQRAWPVAALVACIQKPFLTDLAEDAKEDFAVVDVFIFRALSISTRN